MLRDLTRSLKASERVRCPPLHCTEQKEAVPVGLASLPIWPPILPPTQATRAAIRQVRAPLLPVEPVLLPFVEEVRLGAAQIDYLRAPVPVLLQGGALLAIEGVRDAHPAADDAPPLRRPVVALVADPDQGLRPHVRVADDALAVALLAQPAYRDARLLAAHDQVRLVLRHGGVDTKVPWLAAGNKCKR
eukprot:CAMPEP_0197493832 /NCGR_PEP_ID=MMETSP1311-20131121/25015_1 /TAXON_ID=464262 /ORGANISM="Genus nov. species nov., Strain RCC856" /LENGTH=188 /DNA_ID=CAMNT_0043039133 /DNA_START=76 /DNA_END=642 /DNA_ORIENTATION=-